MHYFSPFLSCWDVFIHASQIPMRPIHLCAAFTHSSLIMYQPRCLMPSDQFFPLSCITFTAPYLLACIFSLPYIKSNVQLLVKKIRADARTNSQQVAPTACKATTRTAKMWNHKQAPSASANDDKCEPRKSRKQVEWWARLNPNNCGSNNYNNSALSSEQANIASRIANTSSHGQQIPTWTKTLRGVWADTYDVVGWMSPRPGLA